MHSNVPRTLTGFTTIQINGQDARQFLQGQLTLDIDSLNNNANSDSSQSWQFAAYCNPKGRMLALLTVWAVNDDYFLLLPSSLSESISKRLKMYVMRSKVNIQINDTDYLSATSTDQLSEFVTDNDINQLQESDRACLTGKHHTVLSFGDHYLIIRDKKNEQQSKEISGNASDSNLVSSSSDNAGANNQAIKAIDPDWKAMHLRAGLPQIYTESSEVFIPQMLNLDKLNGISFDKGCYTGQEIIARMHYLGNVKQRMFVLEGKTLNDKQGNNEHDIKIGDKIFNDVSQNKSVGQIADFIWHSGQLIMLAVLRIEAVNDAANDNILFYTNNNELRLSMANQPPHLQTD